MVNKTKNYLSPQTIEHKNKKHDIGHWKSRSWLETSTKPLQD